MTSPPKRGHFLPFHHQYTSLCAATSSTSFFVPIYTYLRKANSFAHPPEPDAVPKPHFSKAVCWSPKLPTVELVLLLLRVQHQPPGAHQHWQQQQTLTTMTTTTTKTTTKPTGATPTATRTAMLTTTMMTTTRTRKTASLSSGLNVLGISVFYVGISTTLRRAWEEMRNMTNNNDQQRRWQPKQQQQQW